jgi:hypothetical protein
MQYKINKRDKGSPLANFAKEIVTALVHAWIGHARQHRDDDVDGSCGRHPRLRQLAPPPTEPAQLAVMIDRPRE